MILYNLKCDKDHVFETWFRDSATYDVQVNAGDIGCPVCGSTRVEKAIMAPRVAKPAGQTTPAPEEGENRTVAVSESGVSGTTAKAMREVEQSATLRRALLEIRRQVEENFDYVGPNFAEEARKIHYGETEERAIYGETTDEQSQALEEEGVRVRRIPWLPRENS